MPEYDKLKESYCLFVNEKEVDFAEVIGLERMFIAKLQVMDSEDNKTKIMIELK